MNTAACNPMIELYFSELEAKIADSPKPARQEFLQELRAHVLDRLQQAAAPTEDQCRAILAALGTPEEIARHYRVEAALSRAKRSNSPLLLLRSTLRWALTGAQGFAVFMIAFIGYVSALSFYILAILKPIFPHNVGLFVGSFGFNFAYMPHPHGRELLGVYFPLVTLFLGLFLMQGTTLLIRFLITRVGKLKQRI
jgi:uncharacterized membrane protein